jgi:hypothetical protein
MNIEYDKPFEVTEAQYRYLIIEYSGAIAHRKENGKFYIKLWTMSYKEEIEKYLNSAK